MKCFCLMLLSYTEVFASASAPGGGCACAGKSRRTTHLVISIVIVDCWARMINEELYILYIIYVFHSIYEIKNNVMIGNITHCSKCTIKLYYTQC